MLVAFSKDTDADDEEEREVELEDPLSEAVSIQVNPRVIINAAIFANVSIWRFRLGTFAGVTIVIDDSVNRPSTLDVSARRDI